MRVAFPILLLAVAALHAVGAYPQVLLFGRYAHGDPGWVLTTDQLVRDGLTPSRDFAYFYGLLPLLIDRVIFAMCGATPESVAWVRLLGALAVAVGVARVALALRVGVWGGLVMVCGVGFIANPEFMLTPIHVLEAVCVVHALADQIRGKPNRALAWFTLAVLAKPSIGYFGGLMLLVECFVVPTPDGKGRWRRLIPAAAVGVAGLLLLIARFGPEPVLKTQLPLEAGKVYTAQNFGFFHGDGRHFWHPDGADLRYYVFSPFGMWAVSTAVLLVGAALALPRWRFDPAARFIVLCAVLHTAFVTLFFGNRLSWFYYAYLPILGAAAVIDRLPTWFASLKAGAVILGVVLSLLLLLGTLPLIREYVGFHKNYERSAVAAGLYLDKGNSGAAEKAWQAIRERAKTEPTLFLTRMGCASQLAPELVSPRSWYLHRAIAVPGELDRVRDQIAACNILVVTTLDDNDLMTWPEFAEVLRPFQEVEKYPLFKVYRRTP